MRLQNVYAARSRGDAGKWSDIHCKPEFVHVVDVVTAKEMYEEVTKRAKDQDIIIKAAAVADYRPKSVSSEKMKRRTMIWRFQWSVQMIS